MAKIQLHPLIQPITQSLVQETTPIILAGNLDETELFFKDIPANFLGKKGGLRIELTFSNYIKETNSKIIKIKFGSVVLAMVTVTQNPSAKIVITINNRNNPASQVCFIEVEAGDMVTLTDTTIVYTSQDTTTAKTISITATTTLESALSVGGSSLARTGTEVKANFAAHGYNQGDFVKIEGANQSYYNGVWEIYSMETNFFYFQVPYLSSFVTPATGSITSKRFSRITLESCEIELLKG